MTTAVLCERASIGSPAQLWFAALPAPSDPDHTASV